MKEIWKVLFALAVLWGNTCKSLLGSSEDSSLSQDRLEGIKAENISSLRLCIRVYNQAEIPPATLDRAIKEADRIFQQAGINTEWVECAKDNRSTTPPPKCDKLVGPLMLDLKILFRPENTGVAAEDTLFGVALPYEQGGVQALLFYHHIDTFARSGAASRSLVLAHAMAHEVGHLLLWSKSHSAGGIMKASWLRGDLQAIEQGKLAFSLEEAGSMKTNLLVRQKHYELIVTSGGSIP